METVFLRLLRKLYLLSVLVVCTPLAGNNSQKAIAALEVKERVIVFNTDRAETQLKDEGLYFYRDIDRLDSLTYNLIDSHVSDSTAATYALDRSTLISCIQTIAISEGSVTSKRGNRAFRSSLFIYGNNPYGIKGKGSYVKTVEYFDGVRHVLMQNFQSYLSFRHATQHLLHILSMKRYDGVREATSIQEFFNALKRGGYLTAPVYHKMFLIPYAEKLNIVTQN